MKHSITNLLALLFGIVAAVAFAQSSMVIYDTQGTQQAPVVASTTKTYTPAFPKGTFGQNSMNVWTPQKLTDTGAAHTLSQVSNVAQTEYKDVTGAASITALVGRREVVITLVSDDADDELWVNIGSTTAVIGQCIKVTDNITIDVSETVAIGLNASESVPIAIAQIGYQ